MTGTHYYFKGRLFFPLQMMYYSAPGLSYIHRAYVGIDSDKCSNGGGIFRYAE